MGLPSITSVFGAIVFSYVAYTIWSMTQIFVAPSCNSEKQCLHSLLAYKPELTLYTFSCVKSSPRTDAEVQLVDIIRNFQYHEPWERQLTLNIPSSTRQNGTLYLNLIVVPSKSVESSRWSALMSNRDMVFTRIPLTQLHVPDVSVFNLLDKESKSPEPKKPEFIAQPVAHLKSQVTFSIVTDPLSMPVDNIPPEVHHRLRIIKGMKYLPIIFHNVLETQIKHLTKMDNATGDVLLKYAPVHIGKFRFILNVEEAMKSLKVLGFGSKDIDDVKNIFVGTNLYLLCATIVIVSFHLLFDFLAFKNDVSFWRNKSSMEGLSSRTVMWRAFSQTVVLLYLIDEQASMIILAPSAVGVFIEIWKVMKVLQRKRTYGMSDREKQTDAYDAESMKYLSYLLYPLCIGGAAYSLLYLPHKSWYSWSINSLVNGVYAFGFLFMLPQLFVNYRLKSVAALPWRSFMYKAFNTFIDDVFAFMITMPVSHRVACFRDDAIFLVYLYQRWLYPVDKSRLDETARQLGEKGEDAKKDD